MIILLLPIYIFLHMNWLQTQMFLYLRIKVKNFPLQILDIIAYISYIKPIPIVALPLHIWYAYHSMLSSLLYTLRQLLIYVYPSLSLNHCLHTNITTDCWNKGNILYSHVHELYILTQIWFCECNIWFLKVKHSYCVCREFINFKSQIIFFTRNLISLLNSKNMEPCIS